MTTITTVHNRPPEINQSSWENMLVQFLLEIHHGGLVLHSHNTFHCFYADLDNSRLISSLTYDPTLPHPELERVKKEVLELITHLITSCK